VLSAALFVPLPPEACPNTPISEQPGRSSIAGLAPSEQALWLARLYEQLDKMAGDIGSRMVANETVLRASQLWQVAFAPTCLGQSGSSDHFAQFIADCREAVSFAERFDAVHVEPASPDLLALARQVVAQQAQRQSEDVRAWAERLARDVGNATD
jgi:hypothetical protein